MPKFSIVIPTRARADTLQFALRTAVEQTYEDIEILVHECGDDGPTREVVERAGDHRTRHLKTGLQVSISENWERALAAATGDYILFIGDDDGLPSDSCAAASRILERCPVDVMTWKPANYYWPQHVIPSQRNLLHGLIEDSLKVDLVDPQALLELCYGFHEPFTALPMIYNSYLKREVADRALSQLGRYFWGAAPDVSSGVVNAYFARSCAISSRPLSLSGTSHHSTGAKVLFGIDESARHEAEAAAFDELNFHRTLIDSRNLYLFVGNEMLLLKERIFPSETPAFSYRGLLSLTLSTLGIDLKNDYESGLAELREIARRNDIPFDDLEIPPKAPLPNDFFHGVLPAGPGRVSIDLDCAQIGIADVWGASRLLDMILPPWDAIETSESRPLLRRVPEVAESCIIEFCSSGNGLLFLAWGWEKPEPWGIWASGRRGDINLTMGAAPTGPMEVKVEGILFLHPGKPRSSGRVLLNGVSVRDFYGTLDSPAIEVRIEVNIGDFSDENLISLGFELDNPTSPAEDGVSSDPRRLGFGLKRLVLSVLEPAGNSGPLDQEPAETGGSPGSGSGRRRLRRTRGRV